jgi:hypothetical protein
MNDKIEVTAATVANMRAYEEAHPPKTIATPNGPVKVHAPRCFAYSPTTGEEFSGSPGDYLNVSDDEPLRDAEGDEMILVTSRVVRYDALTGEAI